MPKLILPIPDSGLTVTRNVIFDVIREVFKATGISQKTMISFPGDLGSMQQPGSDIEDMTQQNGINTLPYDDRVSIDVEENYEADRMMSTAVHTAENYFIFRDDRIETYLKPIYSSADVSINFKYRAVDKVSAQRWRDAIRSRVALNWQTPLLEVSYNYYIPLEFLHILTEIHRLRENVAGYGEDYNTYLLSGLTKRATVLSNFNGTQKLWAIQETQLRIVGLFDFEAAPEVGSKEDEADTWTISFAFKFKYDKPIDCAMGYPLVVHNQRIPQEFRPNPKTDNVDPLAGRKFDFNMSAGLFNKFETCKTGVPSWQGSTIPTYDEFFPASIVNNYDNVVTLLVNIDTAAVNPRLLLNLDQMGGTKIHPAVIAFLKGEAQYLTRPGLSIFTVSLYKSMYLCDAVSISVDSNLNVITANDLSLREYYHIRLGVALDWTLVSKAALDRIRNHADACGIILNALDSTLLERGLLPGGMPNSNYMAKADLERVIGHLNRPVLATGNMQSGYKAMLTVETLTITAEKKE